MTYFIKTFGCATNVADSERIAFLFGKRGIKKAKSLDTANIVIINTCMVRESAENRIYGLLEKLKNNHKKIILTGCLVGLAVNDKTGKVFQRLREKFPMVDEFLPITEVGFNYPQLRTDKTHAIVPISNGCNNFCTYCVVPYTRGREVSRPYEEIIKECHELRTQNYELVTLVGQNVNSYGADLKTDHKPVMVKHLGRTRIPTLFPRLLEDIAKMGFKKIDFISSNPWDFSSELIKVIAKYENISREIHLPVQSGDSEILRKMNRWYTSDEYLKLVANLKFKIKNLKLSTDIIVGFPGETEKQFQNTVRLCKKVGFFKAYISEYSPRPLTVATKAMTDNVSPKIKKQRWKILEDLINKPNL